MAHIFLTGATGFIGSFVAQHLVEHHHQVTCLIRQNSNLKWLQDLSVNFITGLLHEPTTYIASLKEAEYVLHLAGVTKANQPEMFIQGNVETTRQLLTTLVKEDIPIKKFVLVSSQAAVGPSPTADPIYEESPCRPLTQYGKSKWQAEQVTLRFQNQLPITIIRPAAVYGPRDTDVYHFFKTIKYGFNLMVGKVDQLVNVVYVEDCASGIIQASFSENTVGKTYFICEEKPYYWSQFAALASDIFNKKYITLRLPLPIVNLIAYILENWAALRGRDTILNRDKMLEVREPYWRVSSLRAQQDFNYQVHFPAPIGIQKTIRWYQENAWL